MFYKEGLFYFMKSLCTKTNNSQIIDYLLKSFENINLEDTYITIKKLKHFNNIIIHYKGDKIVLCILGLMETGHLLLAVPL